MTRIYSPKTITKSFITHLCHLCYNTPFMKLALDKISRMIPDWNRRALTEKDFYDLCGHFGIKVDESPLRTDGFYFEACGRHVIAINSGLAHPRKLFVMFHELGHFLLHTPRNVTAVSWHAVGRHDKKEKEADAFALCAIWPKTAVQEITQIDFSGDDESAAGIFAARIRLLKRFGY